MVFNVLNDSHFLVLQLQGVNLTALHQGLKNESPCKQVAMDYKMYAY